MHGAEEGYAGKPHSGGSPELDLQRSITSHLVAFLATSGMASGAISWDEVG